MIAQIRTISTENVSTYESFADIFVRSIPRNYNRIDLVADTYRDGSIKTLERKARGETEKILIRSLKSKMPADMARILGNGENKTRLLELILRYIELNKTKVFNMLRLQKSLSLWMKNAK